MYNLLIVEGDLIQSHFWVNTVCKEIQNVRLYNVVSTGKEAIDMIKRNKVDLIILNLELPDMNGLEIINFISKNNIIEYKSSIIVITNEVKLLRKTIGNNYIFDYYLRTNNINFLITIIKNLIKQKEKDCCIGTIENQIKMELENLRFNFAYNGTKYLYECICECYYKSSINLNKDIYPIISKKYNKTVNAIKSSIFQSISLMYYETEEQFLSEYFGYTIINKPKTKEIIFIILQKVKNIDFIV